MEGRPEVSTRTVVSPGRALGGLVLVITSLVPVSSQAEAAIERLPFPAAAHAPGTALPAIWDAPGSILQGDVTAPSGGAVSGTVFDSGGVVPASTFVGSAPHGHTFTSARPMANTGSCPWYLQVLPDGVIYRSYLAGVKEPRFASQWVHDRDSQKWLWDVALGGRVGILRYGTKGPYRPEGWEIDIEGAAFPQLDLNENRDLVSCDYRFGIPLTYGIGRYQTKFAYYHLSSHLGDELMVKHPSLSRINYSRNVLVWGHSFYMIEDLRLYFEAGWAYYNDGGSKPSEFQFGVEYSPATPTGLRGAPFWAINGHLREELDFGGNLVVQVGWQWRGASGHLFRLGFHHYSGYSDQYEFFDDYVDKLGMGLWYDY